MELVVVYFCGSQGSGLPRLLAGRQPVGLGATPRRCHAVVAVGLDRSADGRCAARGSDRRPCDGAPFTEGTARAGTSRSRVAGARSWCVLSLMSWVVSARPDVRPTCRHEILLYKARRIVYGVNGRDATCGSSDTIAMRRGLPSAIGHVLVNDAKDSPPRGVCVDDHRLIATLVHHVVRATRASPRRVSVIEGTPATSARSTRATRSHPLADTDQLGVIPDAGWPESVSILFVEVACRRAHALAREERQHDCRENSIDTLRSARVCIRAAIDAVASAGESREHGAPISAAGACHRPRLVADPCRDHR